MLYVLAVEPLSVAILRHEQFQGFVLPNNMEVRLVQHLDDLSFFAHKETSITIGINLMKQFGQISGSVLNLKKSFIIKIGQGNEAYNIERIPVLKHTYKNSWWVILSKQFLMGNLVKF